MTKTRFKKILRKTIESVQSNNLFIEKLFQNLFPGAHTQPNYTQPPQPQVQNSSGKFIQSNF